jgi:HPt (histidine-containing phosphotransfer) domain-containing protein
VEHTGELLLRARGAIDEGALHDAVRLAHSAAGASWVCGAYTLAEALGELEEHARTGDADLARAALDRAAREFDRVAEFFKDVIR